MNAVIFGIEITAGQDRNGNTRRVYITIDPMQAALTNEYGEIESPGRLQPERVFDDEQHARKYHAGRFVQTLELSPVESTPAQVRDLRRLIAYT